MERLGRYQIETELGRGTMSIVYKAFDPRIDRYIAVKVLREQFARNVNSRQRFLREARAAGGLGHPNIVTVFDVGQVDGSPYLAMELLEGQTLAQRLDSAEPLEPRAVIALARPTGSGLSYAHERGVIHRDVKPANIHFDAGSGMVKLLDFGIAGIEGRPERPASEGGPVLGTPAYMAPEQIVGEQIDARCDLYALGVVLYRLIAGQLPFDEASINEQVARVLSQPPPALKPLHPDTPRELVELTQRLIHKNPAGRHASAADVLEELQDIRARLQRGVLSVSRRRRLAWRWPVVIGGLVALVLALGLGHVYRSQNEAMVAATYGFGEGLASVIAREVAEPLLLDDATALGSLVSDFSANPQVLYLHVVDRAGVIKSSTNLFLQDEAVPVLEDVIVRRDEPSIRIVQAGRGDLEFQVPVRFQARRIGEIHLGLDGSNLSAAARSTMSMMAVLFLVAMCVILIAVLLMARQQRQSIERLAWGLRQIGKGHFDFRLEADRRDDFGSLYRRFNDMAMRLQERHGLREAPPPLRLPSFNDDDVSANMEDTREMEATGERAGSDTVPFSKVTRFPGPGS
ncbi:MAG: protein kinase [Wenzhouxiangella sp.]|nr:protein kinase [Wenzhouxiangella sp.]